MGNPKISVIIPAYNAEDYLEETIESVLNQTFQDFELLIVDDGSVDNTKNIVSSFKDPRIRFYQNETNKGIAFTRNRLIDLAKGKYLAILDSDDLAHQNRLKVQYEFLDTHPQYSFVGSSVDIIDSKGTKYHEWNYSYTAEQIQIVLFFHNTIPQSSVMINANILSDIRYNLEMPPAEDYDLWSRLSRLGKVVNLPQRLVSYRIHNQSISQRRQDLMNESLDMILRNNLDWFGISPSEREFLVHKSFSYPDIIEKYNINYLELLDWAKKLREHNREFEPFNGGDFENVLVLIFERHLRYFYRNYTLKIALDICFLSNYMPLFKKIRTLIKGLLGKSSI